MSTMGLLLAMRTHTWISTGKPCFSHGISCLMKGITWGRESHGLFDYGTRHPLKKQIRTESEQVLVRSNDNDLVLITSEKDQLNGRQPLLYIKK